MIRKPLVLAISALILITSIGCSKKSKEQVEVKDVESPTVEQNIEKETENNSLNTENKEVATSTDNSGDKVAIDTTNPNATTPNTNKPTKPSTTPKPEPPKTEQPSTEPKPENPQPPVDNNQGNDGGNTIVEPPKEQAVKVTEIANKIMKEVKFSMLGSPKEEMAVELYPFDRSLVSEYIIYQAMINVKSDEFAIFKVKDAKDLPLIEKGIQKRLEMIDKIWQSYLPDQHEKVKKNIIIKKDNYILFSISDNQAKVEEVFNSFFKK